MENTELTSKDFYTRKNGRFFTATISVLMVVMVVIILLLGIYLISRLNRSCSEPPTAPRQVEAGYVNSTTFRVQWLGNPNADKYTVYVGQLPNFSQAQSINISTSNRRYVDINGLDLGDTYYIFVTSSNSCGQSSESTRISYLFLSSS